MTDPFLSPTYWIYLSDKMNPRYLTALALKPKQKITVSASLLARLECSAAQMESLSI